MAVSLCFLSILNGYSINRLTCSLHKPSISRFKSEGAFSFRTNQLHYYLLKRSARHAEAEAFARSVNLRPNRHVATRLAESGLRPPYPYWVDPSSRRNAHPYLPPAYVPGPSTTFRPMTSPANAIPGSPPPYPYWADPFFRPNADPYSPPAYPYWAGPSITSPANALPGSPPSYTYWADPSFPPNAHPYWYEESTYPFSTNSRSTRNGSFSSSNSSSRQ